MTKSLISIFLGAALVAVSCTKSESINIVGSTTVLPVISKAAEAFRKANPSIKLVVNAGGSGVGINQLGEGKIEIGMASRDITAEEIASFPKVKFNCISIGKDAVVPVVSSEVYKSGVKSLTLQQVGLIYQGKIKNWKELGGLDQEILCVDKEKSRGTRHVFMEAVLGDKEADAPGADLVLGSNNEEQTAIAQSNSAIGMLSMSWLNKDVVGLNIIMPDGSIISPKIENILNGTWPISRDLFIIVNGEPTGQVKSFVDFVLSAEGQTMVEEAGYVSIKK